MTTLEDLTRDLIIETVQTMIDKNEALDLQNLSEHEIDDLVEDFIGVVKYRLIGE